MKGPHDSQRQKVYDAEGIAFECDGTPRLKYRVGDGGIADSQAFVDHVFASTFLREKYGFTKEAPRCVPGVGQRRRGCYKWRENEIHLPEWTRQRWYVLHECAHALVPRTSTRAAHSWEWAACYLDLVRVYMNRGFEERLIAAFRSKRVKFKPPKTQAISDAERERRRRQGLSLTPSARVELARRRLYDAGRRVHSKGATLRVRPITFEGGGDPAGGTPTQPSPTQPPDPTPAPSPTQPQPGGMIPKDRFDEVNRQARDAARRAEEAEKRLQEIEDANKSEKEKAEAERDREKARADASEAKLASTLRKNALRSAATSAGAIDADVIVAYVNEEGVEFDAEDDAAVAKVIADVQEAKPTLFGQEAPKPKPFGVPSPGTPAGGADDSDDPKMALGKGLLAAINSRH